MANIWIVKVDEMCTCFYMFLSYNCMLILFWAPCDYLYTILNLESSQQLKDLRICGNEIVPRLWFMLVITRCYQIIPHVAISLFHLFLEGLRRSIFVFVSWSSSLALWGFKEVYSLGWVFYCWMFLRPVVMFDCLSSMYHNNIITSMSLKKNMTCASFEDIQKHDTNTEIMSHILPFLLGFPSFQRESRANWTIPAPWPGGGCETARISAQHRSRNCEEMALLRCLVRGWFNRSPCQTTSWLGAHQNQHLLYMSRYWKWETHGM